MGRSRTQLKAWRITQPMRPPFPGMDPWLEHPAIWPDVHNRLIAAIADELTPRHCTEVLLGPRTTCLCAGARRTRIRGSPRHRRRPARVGRCRLRTGRGGGIHCRRDSRRGGADQRQAPRVVSGDPRRRNRDTGHGPRDPLSFQQDPPARARGVHQEKDEDLWVADQPRRDRLASRLASRCRFDASRFDRIIGS